MIGTETSSAPGNHLNESRDNDRHRDRFRAGQRLEHWQTQWQILDRFRDMQIRNQNSMQLRERRQIPCQANVHIVLGQAVRAHVLVQLPAHVLEQSLVLVLWHALLHVLTVETGTDTFYWCQALTYVLRQAPASVLGQAQFRVLWQAQRLLYWNRHWYMHYDTCTIICMVHVPGQ